MNHAIWNDWYFSWGWFLWFGLIFLFFSSVGNWGYTYQAHSKYGRLGRKPALDILDERYAKGEITREEYGRLKIEIASPKTCRAARGRIDFGPLHPCFLIRES